jgi:hypothetical protein
MCTPGPLPRDGHKSASMNRWYSSSQRNAVPCHLIEKPDRVRAIFGSPWRGQSRTTFNWFVYMTGHPGQHDHDYRRNDTCDVFMFFQPLAGWLNMVEIEIGVKGGLAGRVTCIPLCDLFGQIKSSQRVRLGHRRTADSLPGAAE